MAAAYPATGFPALLIRNIYNNADRRYLSWMEPFVDAGYAVVMQDCRGRHDSDGVWDPYMCELNDGFDTHEWVGRQPWCDGQVATFGVSYPGFTQTLPATLRSPALKALVPIASQQDNWGHMRISGAMHWSVALFFANMIGRTMQTEPLALIDGLAAQRHLPLATVIEEFVGYPLEFYRGVIEHDRYDEWWSRYSLRHRYGEVDVPAYFMTGWYDSLLHETLTVFQGWKREARSEEARRLTRILVGPWSHQIAPWGRSSIGPNGEFEDVVFGAHAVGDNIGEHLRWYDARLRGVGERHRRGAAGPAVRHGRERVARRVGVAARADAVDRRVPAAGRRPVDRRASGRRGALDLHLRPRGPGPVVGRAVPVGRLRGPARPARHRGAARCAGVREPGPARATSR